MAEEKIQKTCSEPRWRKDSRSPGFRKIIFRQSIRIDGPKIQKTCGEPLWAKDSSTRAPAFRRSRSRETGRI